LHSLSHQSNHQSQQSKAVAHQSQEENLEQSDKTFQFVNNGPKAIAQRKLQELANNSPQAKQAAQLEQLIQKKENKTGLPDNLKKGIENLSGYSMDDVKVHYNSNRPAQFQAHAYAQGTNIHIASGQEKHLPHEAWHVVQQKQGRVKPTMQMKGKVNINDDAGLEKEADIMGGKASSLEQMDTKFLDYEKKSEALSGDSIAIQRVEVESDGVGDILKQIIASAKNATEQLKIPKDSEAYQKMLEHINALEEIANGSDESLKASTLAVLEEEAQKQLPYVKKDAQTEHPDPVADDSGIVQGMWFDTLLGAVAVTGVGVAIKKHSFLPLIATLGAAVLLGDRYIRDRHSKIDEIHSGELKEGEIQPIPTERSDYGTRSGFIVGERARTDEEINEKVRQITKRNHSILVAKLNNAAGIEMKVFTDLLSAKDQFDRGNSDGLETCHHLTFNLLAKKLGLDPSVKFLDKLGDIALGNDNTTIVDYNMEKDSLEALLSKVPAGTTVSLGNGTNIGHSFTVVGKHDGHVIVAEKSPANPSPSLKYASAVQAESLLALNENEHDKTTQDQIRNAFGTKLRTTKLTDWK